MEKRGKNARHRQTLRAECELSISGLEKMIESMVRKELQKQLSGPVKFQWRHEKGGIVTLLLFFRLLKTSRLIPMDADADDFIAHFYGKETPRSAIRWLGALNQLAYLMNKLIDKDNKGERSGYIVYDKKQMNRIIAAHFVDGVTNASYAHASIKTLRDNPGLSEKDCRVIDKLMAELDKEMRK